MLPGTALLVWFLAQHALAAPSTPAPLMCGVAQASISTGATGMPAGGVFGFNIFAPEGDTSCGRGEFPVIFFVTGFGGNVPASLYSDLLTRVVQRGFIVVGLHRVGYPNYPMEGQQLVELLEWAQTGHLGALMAQHNFSAMPDVLGRTAVMAQSAGNHVVGDALVANCSIVKAFVMIDPVDGVDPYGIVRDDLITPGKMLDFTTPGLLLDNGLDPKRLNFLYPACAPASLSNDRFYKAWPGPIWNINATAYGHVDCLDDDHAGRVSHLVCPSNSKMDKAKYRAMLADAAATFLSAIFEGRPDQLTLLEDPSHFDVDVIMKHDMKGLDYSQVKPGCVNTKMRDASVTFEMFT